MADSGEGQALKLTSRNAVRKIPELYWSKSVTPIGELYMLANRHRILQMEFEAEYLEYEAVHKLTPLLKESRRQLAAYFSGKLKRFTIPVQIEGSEFQRRVYKQIMRIPYGETRSYGEIAAIVGHPRAARAVGTACSHGVLSLVVPYHRVVASSGVGGYGGQLWRKKWLLEHEQEVVQGLQFRAE